MCSKEQARASGEVVMLVIIIINVNILYFCHHLPLLLLFFCTFKTRS
jgi:hypothetical protein